MAPVFVCELGVFGNINIVFVCHNRHDAQMYLDKYPDRMLYIYAKDFELSR